MKKRRLLALVLLVLGTAAFATAAFSPLLLHWRIIPAIEAATGLQVQAKGTSFNLFTGCSIRELELHSGSELQALRLSTGLRAQWSLPGLLGRGPLLKRLSLHSPRISATILPDGSLGGWQQSQIQDQLSGRTLCHPADIEASDFICELGLRRHAGIPPLRLHLEGDLSRPAPDAAPLLRTRRSSFGGQDLPDSALGVLWGLDHAGRLQLLQLGTLLELRRPQSATALALTRIQLGGLQLNTPVDTEQDCYSLVFDLPDQGRPHLEIKAAASLYALFSPANRISPWITQTLESSPLLCGRGTVRWRPEGDALLWIAAEGQLQRLGPASLRASLHADLSLKLGGLLPTLSSLRHCHLELHDASGLLCSLHSSAGSSAATPALELRAQALPLGLFTQAFGPRASLSGQASITLESGHLNSHFNACLLDLSCRAAAQDWPVPDLRCQGSASLRHDGAFTSAMELKGLSAGQPWGQASLRIESALASGSGSGLLESLRLDGDAISNPLLPPLLRLGPAGISVGAAELTLSNCPFSWSGTAFHCGGGEAALHLRLDDCCLGPAWQSINPEFTLQPDLSFDRRSLSGVCQARALQIKLSRTLPRLPMELKASFNTAAAAPALRLALDCAADLPLDRLRQALYRTAPGPDAAVAPALVSEDHLAKLIASFPAQMQISLSATSVSSNSCLLEQPLITIATAPAPQSRQELSFSCQHSEGQFQTSTVRTPQSCSVQAQGSIPLDFLSPFLFPEPDRSIQGLVDISSCAVSTGPTLMFPAALQHESLHGQIKLSISRLRLRHLLELPDSTAARLFVNLTGLEPADLKLDSLAMDLSLAPNLISLRRWEASCPQASLQAPGTIRLDESGLDCHYDFLADGAIHVKGFGGLLATLGPTSSLCQGRLLWDRSRSVYAPPRPLSLRGHFLIPQALSPATFSRLASSALVARSLEELGIRK